MKGQNAQSLNVEGHKEATLRPHCSNFPFFKRPNTIVINLNVFLHYKIKTKAHVFVEEE